MGTAAQTTNTFPASGNVGIGTTSPTSPLTIQNSSYQLTLNSTNSTPNVGPGIQLQRNGANLWLTYIGGGNEIEINDQTTNNNVMTIAQGAPFGTLMLASSGNVGIGTTSPHAKLELSSASPSLGINEILRLSNNYNVSGTNEPALRFDNGLGTQGWTISAQVSGGSYFRLQDGTNERMRVDINGNVGIGTMVPAYALDVTGKIHSSSAVVYPDGSQQTTAWTGVVCGGDYAESVDVASDRRSYEPGDVLVITSDEEGDVIKSDKPYSTAVAGIYATKPGIVGRRQLTGKGTDEVPMAMLGIVPTKVSAENGPIRRGDFLVTSSKEGLAMRGTDHSRMLGAVIGKAMGSLESGTGVIEVLVTLQ